MGGGSKHVVDRIVTVDLRHCKHALSRTIVMAGVAVAKPYIEACLLKSRSRLPEAQVYGSCFCHVLAFRRVYYTESCHMIIFHALLG